MITELTSKAIAVEVDLRAYNFQLPPAINTLWYSLPPLRGFLSIKIPEGSWSILGKAEDLTAEQCEQIMEGYEGSVYLLLKSKGLNPDTSLILIKQ